MLLPTVRQLSHLVALARCGTFTAAAEACHVTQSAFSSSIQELEAVLGVKLAERSARGAELTAAGQEAVRRAEQVLADLVSLRDSVRSLDATLRGQLAIGAIPTIAPYMLPRLAEGLSTAFPEITATFVEQQTEELLASLAAGRTDLAILALPWNVENFETLSLAEDELVLLVRRDAATGRQQASVVDLTGENVILLETGHCLQEHVLTSCDRLDRNAAATAQSLAGVATFVEMGRGVSVIPRLAWEHELRQRKGLRVIRFRERPARTLALAWRPGDPRSATFGEIGELARAAIQG